MLAPLMGQEHSSKAEVAQQISGTHAAAAATLLQCDISRWVCQQARALTSGL